MADIETTKRTIKAVITIRPVEILGPNNPESLPFAMTYPTTPTRDDHAWWVDFMRHHGVGLDFDCEGIVRVELGYDYRKIVLSHGSTIVAYSDQTYSVVTSGRVDVIDSYTYTVKA